MSSATLQKRLAHEAAAMKKEAPMNCSAGPVNNNLMIWDGTIIGPIGSPFEGGIFNLTIKFPNNYPFKPPDIKFTTPVYHPNISKDGGICLDILKNQWSPALSTLTVLLSICSLLTDPNPNDPLEPSIAKLYNDNRMKYNETAREWTNKYANGENNYANKYNNDSDDSDDSDEEESY
jgi:ubiquitin-conjugating enzyme E2 D/E